MVLDILASIDHKNLHKFLDFIRQMVAPVWPCRRCRWPGVPMRHWRTVPHPRVLPGRGLGGGEPDAAGGLVTSNTVTAWIKCISSVFAKQKHLILPWSTYQIWQFSPPPLVSEHLEIKSRITDEKPCLWPSADEDFCAICLILQPCSHGKSGHFAWPGNINFLWNRGLNNPLLGRAGDLQIPNKVTVLQKLVLENKLAIEQRNDGHVCILHVKCLG